MTTTQVAMLRLNDMYDRFDRVRLANGNDCNYTLLCQVLLPI